MSVVPYIMLYLASAATSAALTIYGWQRGQYPGARPFSLLMAALAFWSSCHALSVAGPAFENTLFWAQVQYGGIVLVGPLWLLFALAYADRWPWATPLRRLALLIPAALAYAAVLTNNQHHLWWTSVALDTSRPFASLHVERGILFWLHIAYSYSCVLAGLGLCVSTMIEASPIYRRQARLVVLGALVPIVGNVAHLLGARIEAVDDPTPFLFVVSGLIVFYASLRYRLLDLAPIAQREVFESMPDGMIVLDRGGRIVSINEPAAQILAVQPAAWIGRLLLDLAADASPLRDVYPALTPLHAPLSRYVTYAGPDGPRGVELRLCALSTSSGARAGSLLVLRDRTERMRMEQMLDLRLAELTLLNQITRAANAAIQTDDLLRTISHEIVRALPWDRVAIGTLQPGGATLRWLIEPADAAPALTGDAAPEVDVPALLDIIQADQICLVDAADRLLVGTPTEAALRRLGLRSALVVPLCHQSQPLGVLLVGHIDSSAPITPDEMRLFETVGKLMSEAIIRTHLYEEAQQANQLKSAFLASVSHELRTPLTSIIGFADMLRQGIFGQLPTRADEPLNLMRHSSRTLLRLINDILDFSKLEAGHFSVDLYPVDLAAVIANVVGTMQPQMHERGLALNLAIDPNMALVYANNERMEQVLTNLLSNAIKFTDAGTITVRATGAGDHVRLSVQDTGIGIAPEHQAELFQAFRQIESAHTRQFGGTGLGLAISRRLVELMGGALGVESAPGAGSTFHCDLRVAQVGAVREVGV